MRAAVNLVLAWSALAALHSAPSIASAGEREAPLGDRRWVPSFAITSGVTLQGWEGMQGGYRFPGTDPTTPVPIREAGFGNDRAVTPYVGGNVELLTPAIPMPLRPRAFVSGEVLPMFGPERVLVVDGDPKRLRGPEINTVLVGEEDINHFTTGFPGESGPRDTAFSEEDTVGQGMRTVAQMDSLAYGAKVGVAFGFEYRGRQLRIKPSAGWIHYKVNATGTMVDPTCIPRNRCTNLYRANNNGTEDPSDDFFELSQAGFIRESIITGSESGVFDGVGPGIDFEMDTVRYGPIGAALFAGIHAYYLPGDRDIFLGNVRSFNDQLGSDTEVAAWRVRVAPWIYRAGIGIRFQWLGDAE